jgi:hypothetical protein
MHGEIVPPKVARAYSPCPKDTVGFDVGIVNGLSADSIWNAEFVLSRHLFKDRALFWDDIYLVDRGWRMHP